MQVTNSATSTDKVKDMSDRAIAWTSNDSGLQDIYYIDLDAAAPAPVRGTTDGQWKESLSFNDGKSSGTSTAKSKATIYTPPNPGRSRSLITTSMITTEKNWRHRHLADHKGHLCGPMAKLGPADGRPVCQFGGINEL